MTKMLVLVFLVSSSFAPNRVVSGGPAPADLAAGLADPNAVVRASAAKAIGASELATATPAIPVLVEALDDEAPAVSKATEDAILSLAKRAAPLVLRQLSEVQLADGDGGMGDVIVALGNAFADQDVAMGLTRGSPTDRRAAWIAAAIVLP